MKIRAYGVLINGSLVLQTMHYNEDAGFQQAYKTHYERLYKDNIELVKCEITYETIKQISQLKPKLKKRKKLKKQLKLNLRRRLK